MLLKPAEYEIVDEEKLSELVRLLSTGRLRGSPVGGLTFGVHVPEVKNRGSRVSYPSGPTWQVKALLLRLSMAQVLIASVPTWQGAIVAA